MATLVPPTGGAEGESAPVEWTVWFDSRLPRGLSLEEYKKRVDKVGNAASLEVLETRFSSYNSFEFVPEQESTRTGACGKAGASAAASADPFRFNLRLFRSDTTPFWEDQPAGAIIYTLKLPEKHAPINYQLIWKALSRAAVTGRLFNAAELIDEDTGDAREAFDTSCLQGLVVHYGRNKGHGNVELWCRSAGNEAAQLLQAVMKIVPQEEYGYEVSSTSKDSVIATNTSVRAATGPPVMRAKAPPSFQRKEGARQAFTPYQRSSAVRVFEKPSGRIAGGGGAQLEESTAVVEAVTVGRGGGGGRSARRRGGRGGGGGGGGGSGA
eukprot:Rhum_TRINITY_DN10131_c0_g2::Rhum_TRINITY_DN10131_c0_g2_i1::g.36786::m.36786